MFVSLKVKQQECPAGVTATKLDWFQAAWPSYDRYVWTNVLIFCRQMGQSPTFFAQVKHVT